MTPHTILARAADPATVSRSALAEPKAAVAHEPRDRGATAPPAVEADPRAQESSLASVTDLHLWGRSVRTLHDAFWRSRGMEVVRCGQPIADPCTSHTKSIPNTSALPALLLERDALLLADPLRIKQWLRTARHPRSLIELVLVDPQRAGEKCYGERIISDAEGGTVTVRRRYHDLLTMIDGADAALSEQNSSAANGKHRASVCMLASDPTVVASWRSAADRRTAERLVRAASRPQRTHTVSCPARVVHEDDAAAQRDTLAWLLVQWDDVQRTIPDAQQIVQHNNVVAWIGHDASVAPKQTAIPPGLIVPDHCRGTRADVLIFAQRSTVECSAAHDNARSRAHARTSGNRVPGKRAFDILFSIAALIMTAPLWPLIALAIRLEDGGPVLFAHTRQSRGGRPFACLKFRTMRLDAEHIKQQLKAQNVCDGAQFFVRDDPRQTRIGRWLRRFHLDELPQFINVLRGDMSIVGPRPSPDDENQYCPTWREHRLSVRPGITGLWQVRRTRAPGRDFEEWIRYDMRYVHEQSWSLDLKIIAATLRRMTARR